jgi:hypothetical protein
VWVKLYIGDELSGDAFAVEKLRNVSAFKEAVKEYCQEILTSVAANQLKVCTTVLVTIPPTLLRVTSMCPRQRMKHL